MIRLQLIVGYWLQLTGHYWILLNNLRPRLSGYCWTKWMGLVGLSDGHWEDLTELFRNSTKTLEFDWVCTKHKTLNGGLGKIRNFVIKFFSFAFFLKPIDLQCVLEHPVHCWAVRVHVTVGQNFY